MRDEAGPSEPTGHQHAHHHGDAIPWSAFSTNPLLRGVLALVVTAAVVTAIALALLWPSEGGRQSAVEQGEQLGLGSDRYAATVTSVSDGPCSYSTSQNQFDCRLVMFVVDEGPFTGESHAFQEFNLEFDSITPNVSIGRAVIAGYESSTDTWFYADLDRRAPLVWLTVIFAAVVIGLGRFRGLAALAGMAITLVVLIGFVAPSVFDGNDPLLVSVVAAIAIAFVSLYLTHGFNPTTTVALAGTIVSLGLTLALSSLFFAIAGFTGLASEDALLLPFLTADLDLTALLLGGAVLGTLGALDDVTVTQVATVAELNHRSPDLSSTELIVSGIRVGRDHIASTVNTLLLAYAGASMPLLLLFAASDQGLDKIANAELIAVEIVRTLCGSIGLVAAVPITTVLAALVTRPDTAAAVAHDDEPGANHVGSAHHQDPDPIDITSGFPDDDPADAGSKDADPDSAGSDNANPDSAGSSSADSDDESPPNQSASWDDFAPTDDGIEW